MVYYKDKTSFDNKIEQLRHDGFNKLHIVSDFDRTLSVGFTNNKSTETIFHKLRNSNLLPGEFKIKGNNLFKKYYPMENDPSLPMSEKIKFMEEWWESFHLLCIEYKLNKTFFKIALDNNPTKLREGVDIFFKRLSDFNIPILIFSAGLGEGIDYILDRNELNNPNVHVIANRFVYNDDGVAISFNRPLIHTYNKSEKFIDTSKRDLIDGRSNVILIGDSLGDLNMVDYSVNEKLTIGFFNLNIKEHSDLFDKFKKQFDVVITNDPDFSDVNTIMDLLFE